MTNDEYLAAKERDNASGVIPYPHDSAVDHVQRLTVSAKDVERMFFARLHYLRGGLWVDTDEHGGRWWYRTIDMQGHGSDIDERLAPYDDPRFDLERAVYELEQILKQRKHLRNRK